VNTSGAANLCAELSIGGSLLPVSVTRGGQMSSGLSNGDVVRRFYEGWNSRDINFADLVAEDIVNHQPEAEPECGRSLFADAIGHVMAAVPDSRWTISDLFADGDRVAVRITWSGTYGAPQFRGLAIPAPGAFSAEHIHIYRVTDGKLAEHWVVRDDLTMLRQLGAMPG
jgi:steroid delta-isomerase-like uncharacterized protein